MSEAGQIQLGTGHAADRRIVALARLLPTITRLELRVHSGSGSRCGWTGRGEATVRVEHGIEGSLIFHEAGQFLPMHEQAGESRASRPGPILLKIGNVLRWTVHDDRIALAHRRFGAAAEVALVELVPVEAGVTVCDEFISMAPHQCGHDSYLARLRLSEFGFTLIWRVTGPRKDETLHHAYRPQ